MTGEVTLRGRVLEIGGLKEKLLAAHRAGISNVVIPQENVKDLSELPSEIVKSIKILAVEHVDDVLRNALNFDESDAIEPRIGSIRAPKSISELRH